MRKISLLSIMLFVFTSIFAGTPIRTDQTLSGLKVLSASETSVEFQNHVGDIHTMNVKSKLGDFVKLQVKGYYPSNDYGMPDLPEISRMVEIPYGAKPHIEIISFDEEIIFLNELGIVIPMMPAQPSVNKSQDPETIEFVYNQEFYESGNLYSPDMVKVEKSGKLRGVQMARVTIRPFEYNAADNSLIVHNNIHVRISFEGGDLAKSRQLKEKHYSPVFESIFSHLVNYQAPTSKDVLSQYPIKYVIVSDPMFETTLQPFIEWKTQKGFNVVEAYTDNSEVGTTTASIKTYLQSLYDAGTASDPSPSYVLFVGDVGEIPTFDGAEGSHVSDMYYCEYDGGGDYIPEVYFGRFSATNISELTPQINKTLQFEKYTMPDPSYLANSVLVAGVDSYWAPTHANGQVNYLINEYFNVAHGIIPSVYLYPASGNSESSILADITAGAGYVNYSAHCNVNGWGDPSFTIADVPNLNNENMYFVGVSNCCLPNTFDQYCFGEALLRAENEGAVVHVGGSNSTYWDEDYYWSVGLSSNPNANPTYSETGIGMADALFHENGEEPYITTAQMIYSGNMAVEASSSTRKKYYWEIYHVMGDPSLMPYLGMPSEMTVSYLNPQPIGVNSLSITAEAGAYVAISLDGVLLDARLADETGIAQMSFDAITSFADCDIVVTKQNRQPYIGTLEIIPNDNDNDIQLSAIIAPQALLFIDDATFQPEVEIRNLGQLTLTSASVNYQINDEAVVTQNWTGSLATLENVSVNFPEISLDEGDYTITAWATAPNGETDEYPQNDTLTRSFTVYSGDVSLTSIIAPEDMNCNVQLLTPEITVKNNDVNTLTSLTVGYTCGSVVDEFIWTGSLEQGQETNVQFNAANFPAGLQNIAFYISEPNGGADMDDTDNTKEKEFRVTIGQLVQLDLLTDYYASETTWELVEDATGVVLYTNGPLESSTHHYSEWCLDGGCYTFTIFDSYGDGMTGSWGGIQGEVVITNLETNEVYGTINGDFGADESISFCIEMNYFDVSPTSLDFGNVVIEETAELSYQISASGLTSDITIAAPAGFLVSLVSGEAYTDELVITPTDGVVNQAIFVEFIPENQGSYNDVITNLTDGFDPVNVNVSGDGAVGINHAENMNVTAYPNPSSGIVFIEADCEFEFELIDALGRVLMSDKSQGTKYKLNLLNFDVNLFVLKVITEQGTKIMKVEIAR